VALVVLAEELTFRLGFEVRRVVGVAAHHPMSGSSLSWARRALGIGTAMGTIERRAADVLRALAHMT
jgi:hypothetical protein